MDAFIGFIIIFLFGLIWAFILNADFWQAHRNSKFLDALDNEDSTQEDLLW